MTKHNEDPCGLKTVYTAQGLAGTDGDPGTPGADGTNGTDAATLVNSYVEVVSGHLMIDTDPGWGALTYYVPPGYSTLKYDNTSGAAMVVRVDVGYSSGQINLVDYGSSWVYCGIFLSTDLVNPLYEVENIVATRDNPDNTSVYQIGQTGVFFNKVTIPDGDSVVVQFRTKGTGEGYLRQGQLFVQELTQ